jgi:hypothetical protein
VGVLTRAVAWVEGPPRPQHAGVDQGLDHGVVGVTLFSLVVDDAFSREARGLFGEGAVLVNGIGDGGVDAARFELTRIRHPDIEVFAAVPGCGVDEAGAGVVGDVIAFEQRYLKVVSLPLQRVRSVGDLRRIDILLSDEGFDFRGFHHLGGKLVSENELVTLLGPILIRRFGDFVKTVGDFWRIADGSIARQRPWRRGPDHDRCANDIVRHARRAPIAIDRKLHPHHIRRVVLVFDLGFRQRGFLHHAPHHRLGATIQRAVGGEFHLLTRDLRFGEIIHGRVRMIPVADDAQPLEFLALHVEPVPGIGAALFPERHHGRGIPKIRLRLAHGAVVFLLDLPFDRQAVAVPARHVIGIEAEHLLALGHHVLEDLVERMPDMDVAIGVGRAVMKHEFRPAAGSLAQPLVEGDLVPVLEDFRLALRQAGAHREFRLRQEQGFGIVGCVGLLRLFGHECSGLAQRALKRD